MSPLVRSGECKQLRLVTKHHPFAAVKLTQPPNIVASKICTQPNGPGQKIVGYQTGCTTWLKPRFFRGRPARATETGRPKKARATKRTLKGASGTRGGRPTKCRINPHSICGITRVAHRIYAGSRVASIYFSYQRTSMNIRVNQMQTNEQLQSKKTNQQHNYQRYQSTFVELISNRTQLPSCRLFQSYRALSKHKATVYWQSTKQQQAHDPLN